MEVAANKMRRNYDEPQRPKRVNTLTMHRVGDGLGTGRGY